MPFLLVFLESIEFLFLKKEKPEMFDLLVSVVQMEAKSAVRSQAKEDFLDVVVDDEDEKIDDNLDLNDFLLDSVDARVLVLYKSELDLACLGTALVDDALVDDAFVEDAMVIFCFSLEPLVTGTKEFNKS